MKKRLPTIILILVFLTGLSLLLYPTISDWWNSFHQSRAIVDYVHSVEALDDETYKKILSDAKAYNKKLLNRSNRFVLSKEETQEYNSVLNPAGTGIMGYIEIPQIQVSLPVYHGTSDEVLSSAIGHIAGSSLPVGGKSTHCVLSGHRGLPSAKLFSNLDKLAEGDIFILHTLDEVLTYEVDQIRIVEPKEVNDLTVEEGKDYCTLVTCTPYGINTHRLLVRGHRIKNIQDGDRISPDALQIDTMLVAPIIAAPIILILLIIVFIKTSKKKTNKKNKTGSESSIQKRTQSRKENKYAEQFFKAFSLPRQSKNKKTHKK